MFIGSQRADVTKATLAPTPLTPVPSGFSHPLWPLNPSPVPTASTPLLPTPLATFPPTRLQPHLLSLLALHDPGHLPSEMSLPVCHPHLLILPSACFISYHFFHLSLSAPSLPLILSLMGALDDTNRKWKAHIQRISSINDTVFFIYYDCHAISCFKLSDFLPKTMPLKYAL